MALSAEFWPAGARQLGRLQPVGPVLGIGGDEKMGRARRGDTYSVV